MSTALMFLPFLVPSPEHLWASKEEKAYLMSHTPGHPKSKLDQWVGSLCLNGQRSCRGSLRHCQALVVNRREVGLPLPALLQPSLPAPGWVRPAGLPLPAQQGKWGAEGLCLTTASSSVIRQLTPDVEPCLSSGFSPLHAASSTKTPRGGGRRKEASCEHG